MPWWLVWTGWLAWSAPCSDPVSVARVDEVVAEAEVAYLGVVHDDDEQAAYQAFEVAASRADEALDCVDAVVPPDLAARWHRLAGLRAFARDEAAARRAWQAALALVPHAPLLGGALAAGAPEVRGYHLAPPVAVMRRRVVRPRGGAWRFDGIADARPVGLPTVAQRTRRGRVVHSAWLEAGAPLPSAPSRPPVGSRVMVGVGAGMAVVGAAVLGAGLATWSGSCRRADVACAASGGLDGDAVRRFVEGAVNGGAAVAGVGVAAALGGGVWMAVQGSGQGGAVRAGGAW